MPGETTDAHRHFVRLISSLSGKKRISMSALRQQLLELPAYKPKQRTDILLSLATQYRKNSQLGRLRACILLGFADPDIDFVQECEQRGLLLVDGHAPKAFRSFLSAIERDLLQSEEHAWLPLARRLSTYSNFAQLYEEVDERSDLLSSLNDSISRSLLPSVMCITSLAFLSTYFGANVPDSMKARLDGYGSPEDVASAVSALVAMANEYRTINAADLRAQPESSQDPSLAWDLVDLGIAHCYRRMLSKDISLFGYELERLSSPHGPIYYLRAPRHEFEYSVRLGHIRAELHSGSARGKSGTLTLFALAEDFVNRYEAKLVQRIDDVDGPRTRIGFPLIPQLLDALAQAPYDDGRLKDQLAQEFMFPIMLSSNGEREFPLNEHLTLSEFFQIWRVMTFLALVDILASLRHLASDTPAFLSSCVRTMPLASFVTLLNTMGFSEEKSTAFLDLIIADVRQLGHYDLQYRPFLCMPQSEEDVSSQTPTLSVVHMPVVIATTNVVRNIQLSNSLRIVGMGDTFVEVMASLLRKHFSNVAVNRRVTTATSQSDVDIVVFEGDTIFLFECKHSAYPAESHEMRDLWRDIGRAAAQLKIASEALSDKSRRRDYLAGWFPGAPIKCPDDIRLMPCILCSHRVLSGVEHFGIPVRDYASLSKLLTDAVVEMGVPEDPSADTILLKRFRLLDGETFSKGDLANYLGSESLSFRMYKPFLRPTSTIQRASGLTFARETFVFNLDTDEMVMHLQQMGASQLPDSYRKASDVGQTEGRIVPDLHSVE